MNSLEKTENGVQDLLTAIHAHGLDETRKADKGDGGSWTPAIDLQAIFHRFTLDTGVASFLGVDLGSQLAAIPGANLDRNNSTLKDITCGTPGDAAIGARFSEAFQVASAAVAIRTRLGGLSWLADSKESRHAVEYLRDFVNKLVSAELSSKSFNNNEGRDTFLHHLAQLTQDPIELRDQTMFMLAASRDTTGSLISWLFLLLAKHPAVFSKLRKEIIKEFGTRDDPKDITFYSLKKCQYLQWTLLETLRLQPPGAVNSRQALRDTTIPKGGGPDGKSPIAIRKGQTITLSIYALHRREDLWGSDALEYRPERWDGKKVDWGFIPFSGGPRICLGSKSISLAMQK